MRHLQTFWGTVYDPKGQRVTRTCATASRAIEAAEAIRQGLTRNDRDECYVIMERRAS